MATRKEDKLRPYRVDYFNIDEMRDYDQALVRSTIVRAVTSAAAATQVLADNEALPIVLIRSYRFYKKLTHKKDVYKAVEDLFSEKNALVVMGEVEKYRAEQKAQPEPSAMITPLNVKEVVLPDHATPDPAFGVDKATFYKTNAGTQIQPPTSGPDSPATIAVVDDLAGMLSHDPHEQMMDKFVPTTVPEGRTFPSNADMKTTLPEPETIAAYDNVFQDPCGSSCNDPMPGVSTVPLSAKVMIFGGVLLIVVAALVYFLH